MSRGVLINTLDTYIGTALYEEFLGENPSESLQNPLMNYMEHGIQKMNPQSLHLLKKC